MINLYNNNCLEVLDKLHIPTDAIIVTDPPFNIGYHYNSYKDNMNVKQYYEMLILLRSYAPCVFYSLSRVFA